MVAGQHPDRAAVTIVDADLNAATTTYGELAARSDQVANWLTGLGVRRGDAMIVMLNNTIELWEILLGLLKVGAVAIPTSTLLTDVDLAFRVDRAEARFTIAPTALADRFTGLPADVTRIGVGDRTAAGSTSPTRTMPPPTFNPTAPPPPTTPACCTSPRAPPPGRNWCGTPRCPTRSATCRRCGGSASARATCT